MAPAGRPSRRALAAQATRREILDCARRLFVRDGYAATSVQRIAEEAGVSVQTIYSSVGSKAALVLALNDLIDQESGVAEVGAELGRATDPEQMLALAVHLTRQLNERCGDLVQVLVATAPAEPEVAACHADGLERHRAGTLNLARRLAGGGALAASVTPEQAAATIAMMTAPTSWIQLIVTEGWSFDEAEEWIKRSLDKLLLAGNG